MPTRRSSAFTVLAALALLVTGCTGTAPAAERPTPDASVPPAEVAAVGDGELRIATVFEAGVVAEAEVAGAQLAAREITEQGGGVVVLVHRSAATDPAALGADLAARGIDVVLWGPAAAVPEELAEPIALAGGTVVEMPQQAATAAAFAPDEAFIARLRSADPGLAGYAGGAESYDTVVRIALAAAAADNDSGTAIASAFDAVVDGSFACVSWGECRAAQDDATTVAYTGITGADGAGASVAGTAPAADAE